MGPLIILYENEDILAINKPPGILVHRSKVSSHSEEAMLQIVRDYLGQRVFAVHRLDRATSGVLLFAKSSTTASLLGKQFQDKTVGKIYEGVVRGWPKAQLIDYPLVRLDNAQSQDARTTIEILGQTILPIASDRYPESRYAWIRLLPETGRRHQLRRHMKHTHHPLIGDSCYGHGVHNRLFREHFDSHRLLLHNCELAFDLPNGQRLLLKAPHEEGFEKILRLFENRRCPS